MPNMNAASPPYLVRVGHGYDIHRFAPVSSTEPCKPLMLGTLPIPHSRGVLAVTDGDALCHALTDALLGAAGAGAMGDLVRELGDKLGTNSAAFAQEACRRLEYLGWKIGNIDATVILQEPKLKNYLEGIRSRVAALGSISLDAVSIKAKTAERVGPVGLGEALEVHVVLTIYRYSATSL